jgi:hypothetical protein
MCILGLQLFEVFLAFMDFANVVGRFGFVGCRFFVPIS